MSVVVVVPGEAEKTAAAQEEAPGGAMARLRGGGAGASSLPVDLSPETLAALEKLPEAAQHELEVPAATRHAGDDMGALDARRRVAAAPAACCVPSECAEDGCRDAACWGRPWARWTRGG